MEGGKRQKFIKNIFLKIFRWLGHVEHEIKDCLTYSVYVSEKMVKGFETVVPKFEAKI